MRSEDQWRSSHEIWSSLTKRERQVARRLLEGLSYSDIAMELGVSYHTVNTHVKAIYRKAAVESRARFTARVLQQSASKNP